MGAQAALQAAQSISGSGGGSGGGVVGGGNMDEPKTVLRVIVEHMLYPVTIDILKQVCAFVVCCFTTFFPCKLDTRYTLHNNVGRFTIVTLICADPYGPTRNCGTYNLNGIICTSVTGNQRSYKKAKTIGCS